MSLDNLKPLVRLSIENPASQSNSVYGPGVAALCQGVQETGSLNAAAKRMGMAYSKAWRIVKETEAALGTQMLDRDGAHGSTLTVDGKRILAIYQALQDDLDTTAQKGYAAKLSR